MKTTGMNEQFVDASLVVRPWEFELGFQIFLVSSFIVVIYNYVVFWKAESEKI